MVVEAGAANRAFAKGGRCPNHQATPLNRAPGLHPSDEPLLLCQTSLTPLIGRKPTLSTPQSRKALLAPFQKLRRTSGYAARPRLPGERAAVTEEPAARSVIGQRGGPDDRSGTVGYWNGEVSIGAPGFEPGTSPTRTVRATRLRHA